jgi:hypothetical protein
MKLDPTRYVRCRLADPTHKLPWGGRLFGDNAEDPGHETVDVIAHGHLLAGGSLVRAPKEEAASPPAASKGSPSAR